MCGQAIDIDQSRTAVAEFTSAERYQKWLDFNQGYVEVINVATRTQVVKRGRNVVSAPIYTVTYKGTPKPPLPVPQVRAPLWAFIVTFGVIVGALVIWSLLPVPRSTAPDSSVEVAPRAMPTVAIPEARLHVHRRHRHRATAGAVPTAAPAAGDIGGFSYAQVDEGLAIICATFVVHPEHSHDGDALADDGVNLLCVQKGICGEAARQLLRTAFNFFGADGVAEKCAPVVDEFKGVF